MNPQEIDNLSSEEIGRLFPIILSKPDSNWKQLFGHENNKLNDILDKYLIRIEHIGSTAIPNILAKSTIDILVEIPNDKKVKNEIIQRMKLQSYYFVNRTDQSPPYIMFIKGVSIKGVIGQTYHIHMAEKSHSIWDKVYFRDYLIEDQLLASKYENLKKELAEKHKYNRDEYTKGKTEFVMRITKEAKEKYA